jgi:hypothetical protein
MASSAKNIIPRPNNKNNILLYIYIYIYIYTHTYTYNCEQQKYCGLSGLSDMTNWEESADPKELPSDLCYTWVDLVLWCDWRFVVR